MGQSGTKVINQNDQKNTAGQNLTNKEENVEGITAQNIKLLRSPLNPNDLEFIQICIKKLNFIAQLSEEAVRQLAKKFNKCRNADNEEWLFKQGSIANYFFIIKIGRVQIVKDGYHIRTLTEGQGFGELALIYGNRRSSGIKVFKQNLKTNQYFVIKKETFDDVRNKINQPLNSKFFQLLNSHYDLRYLTKREIRNLAKNSNIVNFSQKEVILTIFDMPHALFYILEGEIKLKYKKEREIILGPNQIFGYYGHNDIDYSISAVTQASCFTIGRQNFSFILRQNILSIYLMTKLKNFLIVYDKFEQKFNEHMIEEMTSFFTFRLVKMYETIGAYQKQVKTIQVPITCCTLESDIIVIGYDQLLQGDRSYQQDYIAQKKGYCASIDVNTFLNFFNEGKSEKVIGKAPFLSTTCERIKLLKGTQNFKTIVKKKQQKFGILFEDIEVGRDNWIEKQSIFRLINIVKQLSCNFIRSYYSSQILNKRIKVQLEYIPGLFIHDVVGEIGILPISIARFYFANIIVGLEYLHSENIIFRNFHFQSFKIDKYGYVWLYNLSNCVNVDEEYAIRTQVIGSPHWQSPEVINQNQLSFGVDFWGLGVLMYVLTIGSFPFGKYQQEPYDIYSAILNDSLQFPINFNSKSMKEILSCLLQKDKQKRDNLKWAKIKQMDFFRCFDWEKLQKKQIESPYLPDLIKIKDRC